MAKGSSNAVVQPKSRAIKPKRPGEGRPKGYDKIALLSASEKRAISAIITGHIRHPLAVMLNYMDALDKAGNLEGAAKFAEKLLPYFSGRIGLMTPPENSAKTINVTLTKFTEGETIMISNDAPPPIVEYESYEEST